MITQEELRKIIRDEIRQTIKAIEQEKRDREINAWLAFQEMKHDPITGFVLPYKGKFKA